MNSLIIGSTSQLAQYLPKYYEKVQSRNLDLDSLKKTWDKVYICFAKQNVFDNKDSNFTAVNTNYTLKIIENLLDYCNNIVVFTTCEMFNDYTGFINVNTLPRFKFRKEKNYNDYIISKLLLYRMIQNKRLADSRWNKVVVIHPFSFESSKKSNYFLFGKIIDSIINKKKINVGNLDFYRDMMHTKFIANKIVNINHDAVIGSGRLFNVREIVRNLYSEFNLSFDTYVCEDKLIVPSDRLIRAQVDWQYSYDDLMQDLIEDIKNCM